MVPLNELINRITHNGSVMSSHAVRRRLHTRTADRHRPQELLEPGRAGRGHRLSGHAAPATHRPLDVDAVRDYVVEQLGPTAFRIPKAVEGIWSLLNRGGLANSSLWA